MLLTSNKEIDQLLEKWPIHIVAFDMQKTYLIRPMPRSRIEENYVTYYYKDYAYAITEIKDSFRYSSKFIFTK